MVAKLQQGVPDAIAEKYIRQGGTVRVCCVLVFTRGYVVMCISSDRYQGDDRVDGTPNIQNRRPAHSGVALGACICRLPFFHFRSILNTRSLLFMQLQKSTTPFQYVYLEVDDNHGHKEYTCIYRFRVHGSPAIASAA